MKKRISTIYFVLLVITSLFTACIGLENVGCNQQPLFNQGFKIPNLLTVLNPKDTFNLNDTLWMRLEIPTNFVADKKSCNWNENEMLLSIHKVTTYLNSRLDSSIVLKHIIPKIGAYSLSQSSLYKLIKENDNYVGEFGLILDNPQITHIGQDTTGISTSVNFPDGIYLRSWENKNCTYDDDACISKNKRKPYTSGFIMLTTFQNNTKIWKINMRQ